jgi:hypothetical protein
MITVGVFVISLFVRLQNYKIYLGFVALTAAIMTSSVFWNILPCSQTRSQLAARFVLVSYLAYFSTLRMGATYFSETSVDHRYTTRRYKPKDSVEHRSQVRELVLGPFVRCVYVCMYIYYS